MSAARKIFAEALTLDQEERAQLTCDLLDTLGPPPAVTEAEEQAEIERRIERVLGEGSRGAPWPEVRARIERALGQAR